MRPTGQIPIPKLFRYESKLLTEALFAVSEEKQGFQGR